MPNPKVGTVTMDVKGAVAGAKGGSVEFRVEKAGTYRIGERLGVAQVIVPFPAPVRRHEAILCHSIIEIRKGEAGSGQPPENATN
jgi:hypothetical protein